ncbi:MAG: hypothetical protein IT323_10560 [Anaerolineae bacterium]|nr:hypothetical protein [Anaerolineae bacterium]
MTILPGLEMYPWRDERLDDLFGMINDLMEQANANYLKQLAAAATHDEIEVWDRYHESLALEKDIDTLTTLYELASRANFRRMPKL